MESSSSSWRSSRSRTFCIQFSKFCLVSSSMTYCLLPFVFPLLPVRSAWFRLMPSSVPFSSVTVCSVMKRSISERRYIHFPPSVVYRMRCPSRIRCRVRLLMPSIRAASAEPTCLSVRPAFLSSLLRMWLAISAICSVNAMYAELSIVITSIRSIFLLFLRQSSAIGKGGFNNSLRDSRKIFWKLSP